jgi:adenylylsulfate kinase
MQSPHDSAARGPSTRAGGIVVWMTGLPSSGKSTLAELARAPIERAGFACCTLDGDVVRSALVPAPGYTPESRDAFYATLARLAAMLAAQGLVVLVPATAHRAAYRAEARSLAPDFLEIFVKTDASECARRDAKGLYAAASAGRAAGLPGVDLDYERPESPDLVADGGRDAAAALRLVELLTTRCSPRA